MDSNPNPHGGSERDIHRRHLLRHVSRIRPLRPHMRALFQVLSREPGLALRVCCNGLVVVLEQPSELVARLRKIVCPGQREDDGAEDEDNSNRDDRAGLYIMIR